MITRSMIGKRKKRIILELRVLHKIQYKIYGEQIGSGVNFAMLQANYQISRKIAGFYA